jgi:hypothetical protein
MLKSAHLCRKIHEKCVSPVQNDNPIEPREHAPEPGDAYAPESGVDETSLAAPTEGDGWGVESTPTFALETPPAALRSFTASETPAVAAPAPAPDPVAMSPAQADQAVIEHVIDEVYDSEAPALETAAAAELLANAMPELANPATDATYEHAVEQATLQEPEIPLGSTEPAAEPVPEPTTAPDLSEGAYRLAALNRKIEQYPDAPANYVLRGELYLTLRNVDHARYDFETAIHLAESLDPDLDWGYINSAFLDRAYENLRQIRNG